MKAIKSKRTLVIAVSIAIVAGAGGSGVRHLHRTSLESGNGARMYTRITGAESSRGALDAASLKVARTATAHSRRAAVTTVYKAYM